MRLTAKELEQRIHDNTITHVLRSVQVHPGDCFFIEAGTLHAIGEGIVIAEVQQNSNVTYRVYDYNRKGIDGKPRELHIQQAIAVANLERPKPHDFSPHLAQCPYFTVDLLCAPNCKVVDKTSFGAILVVDGEGTLQCEGEKIHLTKGMSCFMPADSGEFSLCGTVKVLYMTV